MEKRGQIEAAVIVAGVLIIVSLIVGSVYSERIVLNFRYVGDKDNEIVYDLSSCDISHLTKSSKLYFNNLEDAKKVGYNEAPCNPK